MILTLRTDKPEAEVGLFTADGKQIIYETWKAHRELEATFFQKIRQALGEHEPIELTGLVVYAGPGSFTGLRIGFAVINSMAHELNIPNVKADGDNWIKIGIEQLPHANAQILVPDYGGEANITKPRK